MDQSPAYILAQYLISEAVLIDPAESGDWKVYVGVLPDGQWHIWSASHYRQLVAEDPLAYREKSS